MHPNGNILSYTYDVGGNRTAVTVPSDSKPTVCEPPMATCGATAWAFIVNSTVKTETSKKIILLNRIRTRHFPCAGQPAIDSGDKQIKVIF